MAGALFREVQRFRQPWILAVLAGICILVVVTFGNGMYQQLVVGRPWGNRPMGDTGLLVSGTVAVLITVGVCTLILIGKLTTEVRREGLFVRFFPFHRRGVLIPFEDIASCKARTYSPLREYGGWGIRSGSSGKAYNVSGNEGVQLELVDGKRLLVGSRRAEDLEQSIIKMMRRE